jgi:hypothetical protein
VAPPILPDSLSRVHGSVGALRPQPDRSQAARTLAAGWYGGTIVRAPIVRGGEQRRTLVEKRRARGHSPDPWFRPALRALGGLGSIGNDLANYVGERGPSLAFVRQRNSGARWFDWRRLRFGVFLNDEYCGARPDAPHITALIAHEVRHLQQGWVEALSVRGELVAWQVQYDVLQAMSAAPRDRRWSEIRALRPDSRGDLRLARSLMKAVGGRGYHIELLPLEPLGQEVRHQVRQLSRRVCAGLKALVGGVSSVSSLNPRD